MGLKSSPEVSAWYYYIAEKFIRGNKGDKNDPFFCDKLNINCIGNEDFNPALPWVFKFNSYRQCLVGDVRAYVDDLHSWG